MPIMSFSGSEGVQDIDELTLNNGSTNNGFQYFNYKLTQEIVDMLKVELSSEQLQVLSFAPASVLFEIAQKGIDDREEFANFLDRNADQIQERQKQAGADSPYFIQADYKLKPH
ncbi:hypothetical protein OCF84_20650 (plasmid) [Shewanella xiamenensis]|uniref:Uncharacterized protein n=1 Tax=Shewanella xiamenensis TaxID=332186 RepID=A0ABT6UHU7_9GAMM|nr:hypothetical protein [Shewanella xiamenensis]MDI5833320.1 hypothetical protein [Shewanella xiamenensis]WHF57928.1 hypothetical protein OCF84_20650 [Shewanella xiamenensis]